MNMTERKIFFTIFILFVALFISFVVPLLVTSQVYPGMFSATCLPILTICSVVEDRFKVIGRTRVTITLAHTIEMHIAASLGLNNVTDEIRSLLLYDVSQIESFLDDYSQVQYPSDNVTIFHISY
jgi:hypothetical protein